MTILLTVFAIWAALAVVLILAVRYLMSRDEGPARRRRSARLMYQAEFSNLKIIGAIEQMELKEGQRVVLTANPKTARGNVAGVEPGSVRWTSTDESVVSVTPDPANELSATVEGVDGSANETVAIEFRADGKRGEGVREIVGNLAVTCTQGDAAVVELQAGEIVDADEGEPNAVGPIEPGEPAEPGEPGETEG